jgi:hypothetical protein
MAFFIVCFIFSGPITFSISSMVMEPNRYKTADSSSKPIIVDSIPLHSPPSKTVSEDSVKIVRHVPLSLG